MNLNRVSITIVNITAFLLFTFIIIAIFFLGSYYSWHASRENLRNLAHSIEYMANQNNDFYDYVQRHNTQNVKLANFGSNSTTQNSRLLSYDIPNIINNSVEASYFDYLKKSYIVPFSVVLIILLCSSAFFLFYSQNFFVYGLRSLARVTKERVQGNNNVRIGEVTGCKEVQVVANNFDTMLDEIADKEKKLDKNIKKFNHTLCTAGLGYFEFFSSEKRLIFDERSTAILGYYPNYFAYDGYNKFIELVTPKDRKKILLFFNSDFIQPEECIVRVKNSSNDYIWLELKASKFENYHGELGNIITGTINDVSKRKLLESSKYEEIKEYKELASIDPLTKLFNRRVFQEKALLEVERSRRFRHNFSVAMLDIDFFKQVNDYYGHLVGDEVLKEIGHVLKNNLRDVDIMARYGGEEFITLLPETGLNKASLAMEKIRKLCQDMPRDLPNITVSIGVAVFESRQWSEKSRDEDVLIQTIHKADLALYKAKSSGRNRVETYQT